MGGVSGSTGGSTGSTSGGTKVSQHFSLGIGLLNGVVTFVSVNIVPKCLFSLQALTNNECSNHSFGSLGSLSDKESEVLYGHFISFSSEEPNQTNSSCALNETSIFRF